MQLAGEMSTYNDFCRIIPSRDGWIAHLGITTCIRWSVGFTNAVHNHPKIHQHSLEILPSLSSPSLQSLFIHALSMVIPRVKHGESHQAVYDNGQVQGPGVRSQDDQRLFVSDST